MEVNYVDQYIRKKKSTVATGGNENSYYHQQNSSNGGGGGGGLMHMPQQVGNLSGQHQVAAQNFVDRSDALHLQLSTFEDKMLNITKLVKLSQTLSEEKENDLRKENHELKVRLRRQEQHSAKLGGEIQELQDRMQSMLSKGLQATQVQFKAELSAANRHLEEQQRAIDAKNGEMHTSMVSQVISSTDKMLNQRLADLKEDSIDRLKSAAADHCSALDAVSQRFDLLEQQTLKQYQTLTEERIETVTSTMKDAIMAEVRTCVRSLNEEVREDFEQVRESIAAVEGRVGDVERELGEFVASYRDNTHIQSLKAEETNAAFKDLVELQEKTRSVVGGELEKTKEFTTRNLHRLKKHIDTLNADIGALKESQVDMSGSLERLKRHHSDEREKLSALLSAKTKEANALTNMVDREIAGIHNISKKAASSSTTSAQGCPQGGTDPTRSPPHPSLVADLGFPRAQPAPVVNPTSMFEDLSFNRQRGSQ